MGLDPVVLFFVFGLLAGLLKSELKLPPALYETLSIMLLLAIGLHGGVELAEQASLQLLGQAALVLGLGVLLPVLAFGLLRGLGFDRVNAAAVAAHYGSVSAGTFAVVVAYMVAKGIDYESYMPLFVAILEIPAILVGILLAKGLARDTNWRGLGREIFLGKSIMLLLGGLIIGAIAGKETIQPLAPLYTSMFKPVLAFFLLEMGLIASGQLGALKQYGVRLLSFALLMPLFGALYGAVIGRHHGAGDPVRQCLLYRRARRHAAGGTPGQPVAVADGFAGHNLSFQHSGRHPAVFAAVRKTDRLGILR